MDQPLPLDPKAEPHAAAARLRAAGAVVRVELPGGVLAWAVTKQQAARQVLADPLFVKELSAWGAWRRGEVPPDWPLLPLVAVANMTTATGADHTRLRTLVARAFTPARVARLRPRIEAVTAELLDALDGQRPDTPVDLRARFALPLPVRVICELFGVPAETDGHNGLGARIRAGCAELFGTAQTPEQAHTAHLRIRGALGELADLRRDHPGDDLTSALVTAHADHDRLSRAELVDTLLLMLVAGHETTVNLVTNAVLALLTHPDQLALVQAGRIGWETVVEETLRWDAPVANLPFRYATADTVVAGQPIAAGEAVLLCYLALGRDSGQHGPAAARFDLTRPATAHLSFGHGPHFCLGAALARAEAGIALSALFARFPDLTLVGPPVEPVDSLLFNARPVLPVLLELLTE